MTPLPAVIASASSLPRLQAKPARENLAVPLARLDVHGAAAAGVYGTEGAAAAGEGTPTDSSCLDTPGWPSTPVQSGTRHASVIRHPSRGGVSGEVACRLARTRRAWPLLYRVPVDNLLCPGPASADCWGRCAGDPPGLCRPDFRKARQALDGRRYDDGIQECRGLLNMWHLQLPRRPSVIGGGGANVRSRMKPGGSGAAAVFLVTFGRASSSRA